MGKEGCKQALESQRRGWRWTEKRPESDSYSGFNLLCCEVEILKTLTFGVISRFKASSVRCNAKCRVGCSPGEYSHSTLND